LQNIDTYITRLQKLNSEEILVIQQYVSLTSWSFLLVVFLTVTLNSFLITKNILAPLARLREGMDIVGRGNLSYRVGMERQDEIGELSRAFDTMSENLQRVTATRDDLNREIKQRSMIQEELTKRTRELQEKLSELERFRQATIDREFRMDELRREIECLKRKAKG